MGFDQRVERLLVQLEAALPALSQYNDRINECAIKMAGIESTLDAHVKSLSEAWQRIEELRTTPIKRVWDILLILLAGGLSFAAGYALK